MSGPRRRARAATIGRHQRPDNGPAKDTAEPGTSPVRLKRTLRTIRERDTNVGYLLLHVCASILIDSTFRLGVALAAGRLAAGSAGRAAELSAIAGAGVPTIST